MTRIHVVNFPGSLGRRKSPGRSKTSRRHPEDRVFQDPQEMVVIDYVADNQPPGVGHRQQLQQHLQQQSRHQG